jgi:hypothetical protein
VLLAALAWVACAPEKAHVDQELKLHFEDPNTQYKIDVGDNVKHDIELGSREVRLRVSGAAVMHIVVTAYENGVMCASAEIDVKPDQMDYIVVLTCSHPDAGPPVTNPEPMPDAGPDLGPDTGPSACQAYCQTMDERCPGVYPNGERECLETCAAYGWPAGGAGSGNNDIQCRIDSALTTPAPSDLIRCYRAGPTGGNRCASLCQNYCEAAARNCPGLVTGGSEAACVSSCFSKYPGAMPALRTEKGDSIECRIFWLGEAGKDGGKSCALLAEGAQDSPCKN